MMTKINSEVLSEFSEGFSVKWFFETRNYGFAPDFNFALCLIKAEMKLPRETKSYCFCIDTSHSMLPFFLY